MLDPDDAVDVVYVDSTPARKATVPEALEDEDDRITVHAAGTPQAGLALLDRHDTDCIVSGYEFPDADGIQFLSQVRAHYPDLPFILFTAAGSERIASEAISAGVTEYLRSDAVDEPYTLLADNVVDAVETYRDQSGPSDSGALRKYRRMVNSMREAAWIYDPEGRFVVVNEALARWYNTTRDELEGSRGNLVDHARKQRAGDPFQELLDGERDEFRAEAEMDFPGHGHAIVEYRLTPLTMAGAVDGIVGVARDITETKRRENRLRRYKTILETINDAAFVVDDERRVTYANPAALANVDASPAEIYEEPIVSLVEQFSTDRAAAEFADVLDTAFADADPDDLDRVEFTLSVDGEERVYEHQFSPITEDGDVTHVVVVSRDVTDQKDREQRLERQNERLDRFASVVGHDLRNPLHLAASRLELASEECESDHVGDALDAIERSQTLVDDLLTLAREGEDVTEPTPVEIRDIAQRCWETVETDEATLTVESTMEIRADPSRLKQLFENLYRNAVEHGGREVTVTVGELSDGFYVEDDGSGLPEATSEEIFVDGYSTDSDGTGFGLVIVRNVVEAHDWDIDVTDGSDGGARFEITDVDRPDR